MAQGMNICNQCNKEIVALAAFCPFCGNTQVAASRVSLAKSTSQVDATPLDSNVIPDGIKGWSWGAFTFNWIWAIGNRTWIGLLALIPYVGFIMAIVLGFKGREWAWKNKKWDSVEHFNRVQKIWSIWGVVLLIIALIGIFAAIAVPSYQDYVERAKQSAIYTE
jgi:hypothetical protein